MMTIYRKLDLSISYDIYRVPCADSNIPVSPCIPDIKHISYPAGDRFTHPTHRVVLHGGVHSCTVCGASAVNKH